MTNYNSIFNACLDLKTLEIIPKALFENNQNPELIGVLLDEFEIKDPKPYYSGLREPGKPFTSTGKDVLFLALAE